MVKNLRHLLNTLVFLSPALTLVVWGSYTIINLCLIAIGIFVIFRRRLFAIDADTTKAGFLLGAALLAYAIFGIGLFVYHQEALKLYGQYLIFLLMPFAYWAFAGIGANQNYLWLGAACGGILSGAQAGYQIIVLHAHRAAGYMDHIQYGNIGVVLATASMVGILHWLKSSHRTYLTLMVLVLGVIGGAFTSLASGSKGGWLSLIIALVFMDRLIRPYWSPAMRKLWIAVTVLAFAVVIVLPQSPVHKRIQHAWNDYVLWRESGSTAGGSVGPRFELWRFGLSVAFEKPLLGFGQEGLMERKSQAIAMEGFDQGIEGFAGLHNHFLHVYIAYGILGLLQSALLLLILFRMFLSKWRQGNPHHEALAVMGILLILAHIEFGMSNALFGLNAVQQIFLFWVVTLAALLCRPSDESMPTTSANRI